MEAGEETRLQDLLKDDAIQTDDEDDDYSPKGERVFVRDEAVPKTGVVKESSLQVRDLASSSDMRRSSKSSNRSGTQLVELAFHDPKLEAELQAKGLLPPAHNSDAEFQEAPPGKKRSREAESPDGDGKRGDAAGDKGGKVAGEGRKKKNKLTRKEEEALAWQAWDFLDDEGFDPESLVSRQLDEEWEPPDDVLMPLLRYQKQFLAWAVKQETGPFRGSILADEMGMGKTIQAISIIVTHRKDGEIRGRAMDPGKATQLQAGGRLPGLSGTKARHSRQLRLRLKQVPEQLVPEGGGREGDVASEAGPGGDGEGDEKSPQASAARGGAAEQPQATKSFLNYLPKLADGQCGAEVEDGDGSQPWSKTTLVVCPVVAVIQWRQEISRFTAPGSLKVVTFHGSKRGQLDAAELESADVVLTTYSTIESEYRKRCMPAKVTCSYCNKRFYPDKLKKSEALAKQQKKKGRSGNNSSGTDAGASGSGAGSSMSRSSMKARFHAYRRWKYSKPTSPDDGKASGKAAGKASSSKGASSSKAASAAKAEQSAKGSPAVAGGSIHQALQAAGRKAASTLAKTRRLSNVPTPKLRAARSSASRKSRSAASAPRGAIEPAASLAAASETMESASPDGERRVTRSQAAAGKAGSGAASQAEGTAGGQRARQEEEEEGVGEELLMEVSDGDSDFNVSAAAEQEEEELEAEDEKEVDEDEQEDDDDNDDDDDDDDDDEETEEEEETENEEQGQEQAKGRRADAAVLHKLARQLRDQEKEVERDANRMIAEAEANRANAAPGESVLHKIRWRRIILDEAHNIKDRSCNTAQSAFALHAQYRWCLSGTPLQNRVAELYSLVRFLRIYPYAYYFCTVNDCKSLQYNFRNDSRSCSLCRWSPLYHYCWWNRYIANPIRFHGYEGRGRKAMIILRYEILPKILLRRTKVQCADSLALPPRTIMIRKDRFDEREQDFYEALYTQSEAQFSGYVDSGTLVNNYAHIFDLLIRLRQTVDHPYLVIHSATSAVNQDEQSKEEERAAGICGLCHDPVEGGVTAACKHTFCRTCVVEYLAGIAAGAAKCPTCSRLLTVDLSGPADGSGNSAKGSSGASGSGRSRVASIGGVRARKSSILTRIDPAGFQSSTKVEALREEIHRMLAADASAKCLVFSQFSSFLDLIHFRLQQVGLKCVRLEGSMALHTREQVIQEFTDDPHVTVFLMSLKAGGVALNLTVASHVMLMDPWWNPAVEQQAQDRIHRLGQYKPVTVTRFIIAGTIEERILKLQAKKQAIFEGTVGGDAQALGRLTEDDLRFLFSGG